MTSNIFDLVDTWNDAGTTFNAIKMNVTDTASAAGSLLLDLQVGGVSKEKTDKSGNKTLAGIIKMADGAANANAYGFSGSTTVGLSRSGAYLTVQAGIGGTFVAAFRQIDGIGLQIKSDQVIGWAPGDPAAAFSDLRLYRDAPNTLAQRNVTNPQALRLYGTYTDAANLERLSLNAQTGGRFQIKPEALGTGTLRGLELGAGAIVLPNLPTADPLVAGQLWNDMGTLKISAG